MSTTTLTEGQMIALPFAALIPLGVGIAGYALWKAPRRAGEDMRTRLAMWFKASSAIMLGETLFHGIPNMLTGDSTWAQVCLAVVFGVLITGELYWPWLRVDDDVLLNDHNELTANISMSSDVIEDQGADVADAQSNSRRRRVIAMLVLASMNIQSGLDGIVLKYNPDANEAATQVAMFFLCKLLESVVVITMLIFMGLRRRWYVMNVLAFSVTVGISTLGAYNIASPAFIVWIYESWFFRLALGGSTGLLLGMALYFHRLESLKQPGNRERILISVAWWLAFSLSLVTGLLG